MRLKISNAFPPWGSKDRKAGAPVFKPAKPVKKEEKE